METLISGNEKILAFMYALTDGFNLNGVKFDEVEKIFRTTIENSAAIQPSTFNYSFETPKKIFVYNTLYNSLVKLTPEEFLELSGKKVCSDELRQKFLESGLCVAAGTNERENYRRWRLESRKHRDHLSINVTTTLKCNARCPYCYEHGVEHLDFDETKIDALINFIKRHKKICPSS
ncbi:MAG: hypothetical protein IKN27_05995 [Selenomonadaceae bacterium]|nr:hypothetical protein [Selenomonadaceae bacterium]